MTIRFTILLGGRFRSVGSLREPMAFLLPGRLLAPPGLRAKSRSREASSKAIPFDPCPSLHLGFQVGRGGSDVCQAPGDVCNQRSNTNL